jgi:pseudoazurin
MRFARVLSCSLAALLTVHSQVGLAAEHVINAEARIFNPDIIYVQPGDTVNFVNMASHDAKSVEGLIPEGAQHFDSGIGNNITVKFDIEGTYAYVCVPHLGFGMVGVIVVGKPVDIDAKMEWAQANLQGPYRRLIAKMLKVQRDAKGQ